MGIINFLKKRNFISIGTFAKLQLSMLYKFYSLGGQGEKKTSSSQMEEITG